MTEPGPQDPRFFAELGDRILDIGLEEGLRPSDERSIRNSLRQLGQKYASSITEGRVREFVKEAAARVADKVASRQHSREAGMNRSEAHQLWAMLGAEGKAPTELTRASHVLPSYSVGIGPWIDRLAHLYFRDLCRNAAHFKLVLAPYGGGKTHFLLTLGIRARDQENFAVAYVPCSEGVSLDNPLDIFRECVKHLQLPGKDQPGMRVLLDATARVKRDDIRLRGVPDVDAAFRLWVSEIRRRDFPENAFGRVMAEALQATGDGVDSPVGDAALRWLQGDIETLGRSEMQELRLARVPAPNRRQFGRDLLLSLVKFLPEAGVHGLVLLMDEVERLFQHRRGAAARRILGAMRAILDAPTGVSGGVPLFGVFSATPDVLEEFRMYPALEQRLAVRGRLLRPRQQLCAADAARQGAESGDSPDGSR